MEEHRKDKVVSETMGHVATVNNTGGVQANAEVAVNHLPEGNEVIKEYKKVSVLNLSFELFICSKVRKSSVREKITFQLFK